MIHSLTFRLGLLLFATVLGSFLYSRAQQWRTEYWLLKDGQTGIALLTSKSWGGHGVYDYEYEVNQKRYTGQSQRNWKEEKYRDIGTGDKSVVYFSVSHPWLSSLNNPGSMGSGFPVVLVALVLELFAIITVINPKSRWALKGNDKK